MIKNKKYILIFFLTFISLTLLGILQITDQDMIWTYGFSYNISKGMIPYKEFNMVIGPLYSFIFSLFLYKNSLIIFKLTHIVIYSLIITLIYKKLDKKIIYIILLLYVQSTMFWYNTFTAMLVLLILYLLDSNNKYKEIFIGLIIGFIIMTKHNTGITLLLVYLLTSKNKLKALISFSLPVIITIITLLINHSFFDYINFCYLGLGNFFDNISISSIAIIICIIFIIYLVKSYLKEKDIKILYLFAYLFILIPLVESIHLLIFSIPLTYYILLKNNNKNITNVIIKSVIIVGTAINIINLHNKTEFVLDNNYLKYSIIMKGTSNYLYNYSKYINNIEGNVYLFLKDAYLIKLYNNNTLTFYDLTNKGNLGKDEFKYIKLMDKECKKTKCTIILDKLYYKNKKETKNKQLLDKLKKHITKNYEYIETLPSDDRVYSNNK